MSLKPSKGSSNQPTNLLRYLNERYTKDLFNNLPAWQRVTIEDDWYYIIPSLEDLMWLGL